MPAPCFVRPPLPDITPEMVSVWLAAVAQVCTALSVMGALIVAEALAVMPSLPTVKEHGLLLS